MVIERVVQTALLEDLAHGNDLTTDSIVPVDAQGRAAVVARAPGVLAGLDAALLAFELLDPGGVRATRVRSDGERIERGDTIVELEGRGRTLLTGERTMLNLLCRLSGIATATRALVDTVAGTRAHIVDTRKTAPGLRALEKYAVRCGGGSNHRFGLDDAVLIKDNHLALAGSIREAVARVRAVTGHMVKIEVEVDTLDQLGEALAEPIDAVLLDNMSPATLTEAVRIVNGRVLTEASGGIRPETIRAVAESGVDLISAGYLTHSAPALDLGLDITVSER
ncbi:MAG: carboxylating nicotinate-nucleotide diphosphorylase [Candidatus Eremiobacteraeota bacterium]|nr:carboxylating nicotinate-nucleotide diphosphorylase [Candidatus Eremiobacteraeota bacterium]